MKMMDRIILKRIQVVRGKKKVKLPFLIRISPGSFPIQGNFCARRKTAPITISANPVNTKNLPIPEIIIVLILA